ncbi:MAG: hypothetical protein RI907_1350 [Pseudomonadota bacterium]|jgi:diguanylate cyclase (GGDEF)-like protein
MLFDRLSTGLKQLSPIWMMADAPAGVPLATTTSDTSDLTQPTALDSAPVRSAQAQRIDALLAERSLWWHFPADLEAKFQDDHADKRRRWVTLSGLMVAILVNWLLLPDLLMVPDVYDLAVRLRLFGFTPLILMGIFFTATLKLPMHWVREWSMVVPGLGATAITCYLSWKSQDVYAGPYLVSLIPVIVFANTVAHMRLWPALFMDLAILVMYGLVWSTKPDAPLNIMLPATMTLVASVVFTLYGCYSLEREGRRNWLLRERESSLLGELGAANKRLDQVSRSDMLTEVANRRHFDEFLLHTWERARVDGSEIALMMIDVDHFKAYNDRYGHIDGDACLRDVADVLKRRLRRPGDLIARFGGEEFIAVLSGTSLEVALGAAERVRKGIENMNRLHAASPTHAVVTVSIGVASLRPHAPHATPAQLIAAADEALYLAKGRGRNRVFAFGVHD